MLGASFPPWWYHLPPWFQLPTWILTPANTCQSLFLMLFPWPPRPHCGPQAQACRLPVSCHRWQHHLRPEPGLSLCSSSSPRLHSAHGCSLGSGIPPSGSISSPSPLSHSHVSSPSPGPSYFPCTIAQAS